MEKYTKNQIEIEAEEYTGQPEQLVRLESDNGLKYKQDNNGKVSIQTLNGNYVDVNIGDYIVIGMNGEFTVMNTDNFHKMYSSKLDMETNIKVSSNFRIKNTIITTICPIATFILIVFTYLLCLKSFYDSNIEKIVAEANKIAIEKASNELMIKTKIEADEIIKNAKEEAKLEADKSFREEMKRLTEEKIGK